MLGQEEKSKKNLQILKHSLPFREYEGDYRKKVKADEN